MKINYWDCEFAEAEDMNEGTGKDPDYNWIYYCHNPKSDSGICPLDNKWLGNKEDCKLLDS